MPINHILQANNFYNSAYICAIEANTKTDTTDSVSCRFFLIVICDQRFYCTFASHVNLYFKTAQKR